MLTKYLQGHFTACPAKWQFVPTPKKWAASTTSASTASFTWVTWPATEVSPIRPKHFTAKLFSWPRAAGRPITRSGSWSQICRELITSWQQSSTMLEVLLSGKTLFSMSTKDLGYSLDGESNQGRGSEWAGRGSDPPNNYQQVLNLK